MSNNFATTANSERIGRAATLAEKTVNMISGTGDGDRATYGVTKRGNRDGKSCIYEDDCNNGAGAENDIIDFGNIAVGGVTGTRDKDIKSGAFKDDGDDGA